MDFLFGNDPFALTPIDALNDGDIRRIAYAAVSALAEKDQDLAEGSYWNQIRGIYSAIAILAHDDQFHVANTRPALMIEKLPPVQIDFANPSALIGTLFKADENDLAGWYVVGIGNNGALEVVALDFYGGISTEIVEKPANIFASRTQAYTYFPAGDRLKNLLGY
jgi:hypothetical protein